MSFELKTTIKSLILNLILVGLLVYTCNTLTYENMLGYIVSCLSIGLFVILVILQHIVMLLASNVVKDKIVNVYLKDPMIERIIGSRCSADELYQLGYIDVYKQNNKGNLFKSVIIMFIIFIISYI